jgi:hypothetical protein
MPQTENALALRRDKSKSDGRQSICRQCRKDMQRKQKKADGVSTIE